MAYRAWDEEDITKLEKMVDKSYSMEEMRKQLDRSEVSILNQLKRMSEEVPEEDEEEKQTAVAVMDTPKVRRKSLEKAAINFLDMNLKDRDYSNVWSSILDFQGALDEKSIEQKEISIKIATKKWIGIAMVGDLHIGNMATDYKAMLAHRDMIAEEDNVYVILNGDYCDNYIPSSHVAGMFEALFPPAVQKNLAKDYITSIKSKVLALVAGCHDIWGMKAADFDLTEYLAKHGEAAYLGSGGTVFLTVGKITYKIAMRHKYRYNNADNPTATVKKMFEKCGGFDVGVVSHNHVACMEECVKEGMDGNKKRLFVRAGTYKTHDRYGKQLGFSEGDIGVPIVLFNPESRDIRGFQDLAEGIEYLRFLNK
jgi:hypothetical protein